MLHLRYLGYTWSARFNVTIAEISHCARYGRKLMSHCIGANCEQSTRASSPLAAHSPGRRRDGALHAAQGTQHRFLSCAPRHAHALGAWWDCSTVTGRAANRAEHTADGTPRHSRGSLARQCTGASGADHHGVVPGNMVVARGVFIRRE